MEHQKPMFVKDIPMRNVNEKDIFLTIIEKKNDVTELYGEINTLKAEIERLNTDISNLTNISFRQNNLKLYHDYIFLTPEDTYFVKPVTSSLFLVGKVDV